MCPILESKHDFCLIAQEHNCVECFFCCIHAQQTPDKVSLLEETSRLHFLYLCHMLFCRGGVGLREWAGAGATKINYYSIIIIIEL